MRGMKWTRLACLVGMAALPLAAPGQVVISQVYGGGGNTGAQYSNDFIELYNKGATAVNLAGWSVQYASAGGASFSGLTPLTGSIAPGGYYLIQESAGVNNPQALPTPDAIGTIAMAAGAGKVALVNVATAIANCTSTGVVDVVGYGATASCFEGAGAAPGLTNSTADFRGSNGCTNSNNNASDFSAASAAAPRNSSSPTFACPAHTAPSGVGSTSGGVCPGGTVTLFLAVTPGANPTSTGISVTVDTSAIDNAGGIVPMFDDGPAGGHGDAVAGDGIFTTTASVVVSGPSTHACNCVLTDAQGGTGAATITVTVLNSNPTGFVLANPSGLCAGESTLITCTTTPGCSGDTSFSVTADLSEAGGSATQQLFDDGTNGDAVAGDGTFSYLFTPVSPTDGAHVLHAVVSDGGGRQSNQLNTPLTTASACTNSSSTVVISQVYGGGGNSGATLTNDFIELYNRGTVAVNLNGWSVQYASGRDDANGFGIPDTTGPRLTTLSGVILPGHYYLVQEAAGAGGSDSLPTPDATGSIALSGTRGAIALANISTALGLGNCTSASVMDLVGYCNGTTPATQGFCNEGAFEVPTLSNTTAAIRRDGGCHDVDNNGIDFNVDLPAPRNSATPAHLCSAVGGCTADFNCDGDVGTDSDIASFFACLSGNCPPPPCANTADFNNDGDVGTDADIESFFRVLSGGPC